MLYEDDKAVIKMVNQNVNTVIAFSAPSKFILRTKQWLAPSRPFERAHLSTLARTVVFVPPASGHPFIEEALGLKTVIIMSYFLSINIVYDTTFLLAVIF
jgi:hypothetical protein